MNENKTQSPLLNTNEMCSYLRISIRRLRRFLAEDETFPAHRIGGHWKADKDELRDWARRQQYPGAKVNNKAKNKKRKSRVPAKKAPCPAPPPGGHQLTLPE